MAPKPERHEKFETEGRIPDRTPGSVRLLTPSGEMPSVSIYRAFVVDICDTESELAFSAPVFGFSVGTRCD